MVIMKAIIYTAVVFGLLCFALKKKDSKTLFNVLMILCWVVIAMSMDSYDIGNYRKAYDLGILRGKEPLFDLVQFVFFSLKIPFAVFKLVFGTVIWLLLYKALKNYSLDIALVAAIFVLGPMMGFGTQLRSSMAGAIVLNALPILLKKDGRAWKYCLLVAIASMFHLMAVFYFVFLIPKYSSIGTKPFRNLMCIWAIALVPVFIILAAQISNILKYMQALTNNTSIQSVLSRLELYCSGEMSPNLTGFSFAACAHLVVFFLTDRMCATMLRIRANLNDQDNEKLQLSSYAITYMRKLNSILVLIVPCYILSMQFDRFHSYFVPVCYSLIVQGTKERRLMNDVVQKTGLEKTIAKHKCLEKLFNNRWIHIENLEIVVLIACLTFCFFVSNRYNETSEFVRIINGIGLFGGIK